MQQILFGMKRAYHGSLRYSRTLFAKFELTSARFDMLYAIRERERGDLWQAALARALGVKGSTVSEMLGILEEAGVIRRRRCTYDKRKKLVTLTELGTARIKMATRVLIQRGFAGSTVSELVGGKPQRWRHGDKKLPEEFWTLAYFDSTLNIVRRVSKDFATLHYPWHPDD